MEHAEVMTLYITSLYNLLTYLLTFKIVLLTLHRHNNRKNNAKNKKILRCDMSFNLLIFSYSYIFTVVSDVVAKTMIILFC